MCVGIYVDRDKHKVLRDNNNWCSQESKYCNSNCEFFVDKSISVCKSGIYTRKEVK